MDVQQTCRLDVRADLKMQCLDASVDVSGSGSTITLDCADWQSIKRLVRMSKQIVPKTSTLSIASMLAQTGLTLEIRQKGLLYARIGHVAGNRFLQAIGLRCLEFHSARAFFMLLIH